MTEKKKIFMLYVFIILWFYIYLYIKKKYSSDLIDPDNKEQKTTIDLALPKDVIRGTENCRISAFGKIFV